MLKGCYGSGDGWTLKDLWRKETQQELKLRSATNYQHLARGRRNVTVTLEEQLGSSWRVFDAKLSFEFIGKSY